MAPPRGPAPGPARSRATAEIEAKFLIRRPEQVGLVLAALAELGYDIAEHPARRHVDIYFDTRDWAILHEGWAFRYRRDDDSGTLTLKSLGGAKGSLFIRDEIEQVLPKQAVTLSGRLPDGPVREYLLPVVANRRRRELFTAETSRKVYLANGNDGSTCIELDLDSTRIVASPAPTKAPGTLEFAELELELKAGRSATLDELARVLRERIGLVPARLSKFERGIQAAGLTLADAVAPLAPLSLSGRDPVLALLYLYLGRQFEIIKRQEPLAWEGIDPEGVHKMRVATRRIRATLKSFDDIFAGAAAASLQSELRWLAMELGHARDADICEMTIDRFKAELPAATAAGSAAYAGYLRMSTVGAYENLVEVLSGDRYATLLRELRDFIDSGPDGEAREKFGALSIASAARRYVRSATRRMLARGDRITPDSPAEEYHDLRKRAKRLRYMLELFREVLAEQWAPLLRVLERLQDMLGEHQDAHMAAARIAGYVDTLPADADRELLLSTGRLMQIEDDRIAGCRRRFGVAWRAFHKAAL